jgi:cytochrome c551/c552
MTFDRMAKRCVIAAAVALMTMSSGGTAVVRVSAQGVTASEPAAPRATFDKYCVTCHNKRLKTAGLTLDELDVSHVGEQAETWEKVLRRLRSGTMPPATSLRPPRATYDSVSSWLESELDRFAAEHPNPGRIAVHRLNRTEYQNVIRDLLALDIDASALLPGDDAAYGFDNIADMLKVSPEALDSYLTAANKISRLAVGDTSMTLGSGTYVVSKYYRQNERADEALPFGSQGGVAVRHYFPYDGEYVLKIRVGGLSKPAMPIEVRVDDSLAATLLTEGRDQVQAPEVGAVEARVGVKAGRHVVGVTLKKSRLENETRFPDVYPWGNSGVFGTTIGSVNWLKVESVDITGPFKPAGPGDTPSRQRIFVCQPAAAAGDDACATKIITGLTHRAFRRPVTAAEVQTFVGIYKSARKDRGFDGGIQLALERLLIDPAFLFRIQRDPANAAPGTPYRLSDVDLASRLSFFLWSSMPDDALLALAEGGKLKDPAVYEQQVRRMLADDRAHMLVSNFATQWLYLRNVKGLVPDTFNFPEWDDDLRAAATRETELFLTSQLREDRSIMELLTANYTFVNERLAEHYGIPGVYGNRFRRITLPDGRRAGLLGQASILAVTSQPNRTSPVQRGKWVLENLLGTPPPPPPANVPDLPSNDAGQPKTIRERMEKHRANPVCAGCHANMDPLGFALENFDAIGKYRTVADRQPVDNRSALPDGTRVDGPDGLRQLIEGRRSQYIETVTEKLLTYALGRGVEAPDMPSVRQIVRGAESQNYNWSSLILGIATSTPFQMSLRKDN